MFNQLMFVLDVPEHEEWFSQSQKMLEFLTVGKLLYAQVIYSFNGVQFVNLLAYDGFIVSYFVICFLITYMWC